MEKVFNSYKGVIKRYDASEIKISTSVLDSFCHIKIKKLFVKDSFFVAFCNLPFSDAEVNQVVKCFEIYLNKENIDCKSLLCVFSESANNAVGNYSYYFSAEKNSFVHPLVILEENHQIYFDKDFDYYGGKAIKKFAEELIETACGLM